MYEHMSLSGVALTGFLCISATKLKLAITNMDVSIQLAEFSFVDLFKKDTREF